MKKLQRYKTATVKGMKQFSEWCTGYDVSALEAENERLREALYKIQNEKCMARAIEIIEEAILS